MPLIFLGEVPLITRKLTASLLLKNKYMKSQMILYPWKQS